MAVEGEAPGERRRARPDGRALAGDLERALGPELEAQHPDLAREGQHRDREAGARGQRDARARGRATHPRSGRQPAGTERRRSRRPARGSAAPTAARSSTGRRSRRTGRRPARASGPRRSARRTSPSGPRRRRQRHPSRGRPRRPGRARWRSGATQAPLRSGPAANPKVARAASLVRGDRSLASAAPPSSQRQRDAYDDLDHPCARKLHQRPRSRGAAYFLPFFFFSSSCTWKRRPSCPSSSFFFLHFFFGLVH